MHKEDITNKELGKALEILKFACAKENFGCLSERVYYMFYLYRVLGRILYLLKQHYDKAKTTIVDISGINYSEMANLFNTYKRSLHDACDGGYLRSYDIYDIENDDDTYVDFSAIEVINNEMVYDDKYVDETTKRIQNSLLESSISQYERIEKIIGSIIEQLNKLSENENSLNSSDCQKERYSIMIANCEGKWLNAKDKFKAYTINHLFTYKKEKERGMKVLQEDLLETFSEKEKEFVLCKHPHRFLYQRRHELCDKSVEELLIKRRKYEYYNNCQKYFALKQKASYENLFVNVAAERMMNVLMPNIIRYEGFSDNCKLVVLLFVCYDLGISDLKKRNGKELMDFINPHIGKENRIKDASTITKEKKNLDDKYFCKINPQTGSIEDRLIVDRYKDTYHYCLTVINRVLGYDLEEKGFADYLCISHDKAPTLEQLTDANGKPLNQEELFLYRDVINGEISDFLGDIGEEDEH